MNDTEKRAIDLVKKLVPNFEKMEFEASIGDKSRSIEFFVTIDDERFQCYELADNGKIDEDTMEEAFDSFTKSFRESDDYKTGEVNKINFSI